MDPLDLRPRTVGETLDAAFKLYTTNLKTLLKLAAVVLLPIGLVQLAVSVTVGNVDLFQAMLADEPGQIPSGFGRFMAATMVAAILGGIGALLVQGASVKLFADAYQGTPIAWADSLLFGARRAWRIFLTALVAGLGAWLGLVFCLAPGVWLWTSWYVAIPALVIEDRGVFGSLGRSFALVKRRFFPVLGVGALAWLLTAVVNQVVGFVVSMAVAVPAFLDISAGGDPSSSGLVAASSVAGLVVSLFTVPFLAAVAVSVYFDLRVRFEGLDLELLAQDLGEQPGRREPPQETPERPVRPEDPPRDLFGLDPDE